MARTWAAPAPLSSAAAAILSLLNAGAAAAGVWEGRVLQGGCRSARTRPANAPDSHQTAAGSARTLGSARRAPRGSVGRRQTSRRTKATCSAGLAIAIVNQGSNYRSIGMPALGVDGRPAWGGKKVCLGQAKRGKRSCSGPFCSIVVLTTPCCASASLQARRTARQQWRLSPRQPPRALPALPAQQQRLEAHRARSAPALSPGGSPGGSAATAASALGGACRVLRLFVCPPQPTALPHAGVGSRGGGTMKGGGRPKGGHPPQERRSRPGTVCGMRLHLPTLIGVGLFLFFTSQASWAEWQPWPLQICQAGPWSQGFTPRPLVRSLGLTAPAQRPAPRPSIARLRLRFSDLQRQPLPVLHQCARRRRGL